MTTTNASPFDVCRWVEGTFALPGDGKPEPWTGRVFLAVCAGGMQDPESCYCREYTSSARIEIGNLRAELEHLRGAQEAADRASYALNVASRRIQTLTLRLSAAERALTDAGLPVPRMRR